MTFELRFEWNVGIGFAYILGGRISRLEGQDSKDRDPKAEGWDYILIIIFKSLKLIMRLTHLTY